MNLKKYLCPKCGQMAGVRIIYGYPGPDLCAAAERGEIELGGCCVTDGNPSHHCRACGHEWRFNRSRAAGEGTAGG